MKTRKIGILLFALVLLVSLSAFSHAEEKAPKVSINTDAGIIRAVPSEDPANPEPTQVLVLFKGKKVKLAASFENVASPGKAKLTWESSNPYAAAVNSGVVSGVNTGEADITLTAKLPDGTVLQDSVHVSVEVSVTAISFSEKSVSVFAGKKSKPVSVVFNPLDATCRSVTWASTDPNVATVDQNGVITGVKAGKTVIYAVSDELHDDKAKPKQASINVTVKQAVTGFKLPSSISIAKGKSQVLSPEVLPFDATNKKVTWSSSNPSVATVDAKGTVSGKSPGTATVICTAADGSGVSKSVSVTVYQAVKSIKLPAKKVGVTKGKTGWISVTVSPDDASNKKLSWYSSNPNIATVDNNGNITGKNLGTCVITVAATDGSNKMADLEVTVEPVIPVEAVRFEKKGSYGIYYKFGIYFHNLTQTRKITYISFDLKYDYNGSTYSSTGFYTDRASLAPGKLKRIGWWDQLGYRLDYYTNIRVYLRSVKYGDGTWDYFSSDTLLGTFSFGP